MSSSFTVSSPCTVLLSSGSVGEDITVSDFELMGNCGELNCDDGRTEILWAMFLYVWADDVKLRPLIRERESDNRVAENMANVAKSFANLLAGRRTYSCLLGVCVEQNHVGAALHSSFRQITTNNPYVLD